MKSKFLLFQLIALIAIGLVSCSDDDDNDGNSGSDNLKTGEVMLSSTELYKDDWVYFSFETGAEVDGIDSTNFSTNADWDIAFHSRLGRTNGGASGSFSGAVYDAGSVDFNSVINVDTSLFIQDSSVDLITAIGDRGPIYKPVPGNITFESAFNVTYSYPPTYECNNRIYVVRTASGKYAKIQITSYYNDKGETGHISFKYAYRIDGSMTFE